MEAGVLSSSSGGISRCRFLLLPLPLLLLLLLLLLLPGCGSCGDASRCRRFRPDHCLYATVITKNDRGRAATRGSMARGQGLLLLLLP